MWFRLLCVQCTFFLFLICLSREQKRYRNHKATTTVLILSWSRSKESCYCKILVHITQTCKYYNLNLFENCMKAIIKIQKHLISSIAYVLIKPGRLSQRHESPSGLWRTMANKNADTCLSGSKTYNFEWTLFPNKYGKDLNLIDLWRPNSFTHLIYEMTARYLNILILKLIEA